MRFAFRPPGDPYCPVAVVYNVTWSAISSAPPLQADQRLRCLRPLNQRGRTLCLGRRHLCITLRQCLKRAQSRDLRCMGTTCSYSLNLLTASISANTSYRYKAAHRAFIRLYLILTQPFSVQCYFSLHKFPAFSSSFAHNSNETSTYETRCNFSFLETHQSGS